MMRRVALSCCAVNLVLLFAIGGWFRVTSLGTAPEFFGDEAWYAAQMSDLLAGRRFEVFTPTRNLLNPFFAPLHIPQLWLLPSSVEALRAPAAACGLLAVVLTYVLLARVLDRTTAVIASALLAVLPIAVIYSRIAWDACEIPLVTLVTLYFALRMSRVGMAAGLVAGYLVHPTTIFLAPLYLGVYAVRTLRAAIPARRLRGLALTTAALAGVVLAVGIALRRSDVVRTIARVCKFGRSNWGRFLLSYEKLLLGYCHGAPTATGRVVDRVFWGVLIAVSVLGLWRLARARRWDRLALVAGVLLSAVGFHLVAGSGAMAGETARYGVFLVVPSVVAFACLAEAALVASSSPVRAAVRGLQLVFLLGLGWALLAGTRTNVFARVTLATAGRESPWTLATEVVDPKVRAIEVLLADAALVGPRPDGSPRRIVAQDWWTYQPARYFARGRREIEVVSLETPGGIPADRRVREAVCAGGYALCLVGQPVEDLVASSFPAGSLRRWRIEADGNYHIVIHRLRVADEPAILRASLRSPDPFLRLGAAEALVEGGQGAEEALPALRLLAGSEFPSVRSQAARTASAVELGRLDPGVRGDVRRR